MGSGSWCLEFVFCDSRVHGSASILESSIRIRLAKLYRTCSLQALRLVSVSLQRPSVSALSCLTVEVTS